MPFIEPTAEANYRIDGTFRLDAGGELHSPEVRYAVYGELNRRRDNAILVCHALSGSARVADWWPELFGEGRPFDTERYCVVGVNVVGSCYGSTGPRSINARTGKPYGGDFPLVTISDMVRAQSLLLERLGVKR